MYGNDYAYAETRIQGTILRVAKGGEPVYVHHVLPNGHCLVVHIDQDFNDPGNVIQVNLDDLDLRPVPLGYVNCAGDATYLMRIPLRRDWKQGLRRENCWSSGRSLGDIPMKDVKNCIMGRYPSFRKAVKDVRVGVSRGRKKTIAWHRHWAVNTDGSVFYKNHEPVGVVDFETGKVSLHPSYSYLKEALQETV